MRAPGGTGRSAPDSASRAGAGQGASADLGRVNARQSFAPPFVFVEEPDVAS